MTATPLEWIAAHRIAPPKFMEGDWAYNPLASHNARVVCVEWDKGLNNYTGGWRYSVPGFSSPDDLCAPHDDAPFVEYRQIRPHCWAPVRAEGAP